MKKKTVWYLLFIIIIITLLLNFKVKYYATNVSSGGGRILDITYVVFWGSIYSCSGTYSYPPSMDQRHEGNWNNNIEKCDVEKLKNGKYNAPVKLIHFLNPIKMIGEHTVGPRMYKYKIVW